MQLEEHMKITITAVAVMTSSAINYCDVHVCLNNAEVCIWYSSHIGLMPSRRLMPPASLILLVGTIIHVNNQYYYTLCRFPRVQLLKRLQQSRRSAGRRRIRTVMAC